MDVGLNFKSAGIKIPGLDEAEVKLQKIHDLISTMGRKVVIDLQVNGAGQLVTATEQLQKLAAGLRLAGMNAQAGLLQGGMLSPGEMRAATDRIAKSVREQAAAVEREYKTAQARVVGQLAEFQALRREAFLSGDARNMLPRAKEKLDADMKSMDSVYSKLGMFRQLEGMADALRGVDVATAEAGQETKKFAEAASAAASPIHRETDAVEKQTAALGRLAKAKAAARMVDSGDGTLMSTKTVTNAKGESFATKTYRGEGGLIRTVGASESVVDDKVRAFREKAAAFQANYEQGRLVTAPSARNAAAATYAADLRGLYGEMGDLGKGQFGQGLLSRAARLEERANTSTTRGEVKESADVMRLRRNAAAFEERKIKDEVRESADVLRLRRNSATYEQKKARDEQRDIKDEVRESADVLRLRRSSAAFEEKKRREEERVIREEVRESADVMRLRRAQESYRKKQLSDADRERAGGFLPTAGRNMGKLAMWSAGTGVLYGGVTAVGNGMGQAIGLDRQFATLGAVYRGGEFGAGMLADSSLRDAVKYGRGADEAVSSAVKFSRLGLTQREISKAVGVSLQAANVAEIGADKAGENLSAVMTSYSLDASQLTAVLDEMNFVSNTLNVTVEDLMNGIARTGSVAKQAKIPLSELTGLIGAGVGATGRPGAEFGNAIKSTIISLSTPDIQKYLKGRFGFDVFNTGGSQKDMSQILRELYVMQSGMTPGTKGELLSKIGGKNQASRLEALFDNYLTAQEKSITAQRALNSAQKEGERILGTTESKLTSLKSAWGQMWSTAFQGGGKKWVNNALDIATRMMTGADGEGGIGGGLGRAAGGLATGIGFTKALMPGGESPSEFVARTGKGMDDEARRKAQVGSLKFSDSFIETAYQGWVNAGRMSGADKQAAQNAEMFMRNSSLSTPENLQKLGKMLAVNVGETESLPAELAGLAGNPKALNARLSVLLQRANASASSGTSRESEKALKVDETMAWAIGESERRMGVYTQQNDPASVAREAEYLRGLQDQRARFMTERKGYQENELEYNSPRLDTFRNVLSGRMSGLDMLFQGAPMIGDYESDKMRSRRTQFSAMDSMAASIGGIMQSGRFGGEALSSQDISAMAEERERIRRAARDGRMNLALQEPAAQTLDALRVGRESASRDMRQYGVGLNETQRLFNTTDGAMTGLGQTLGGLGGSGAQKTGEMIEYGNQLHTARNGILERQKSIVAEIRNEQLRLNDEASKSLLFASRGEQLQASLMKNYVQRKGRMSASQFMAMDEDTRKGFARYAPEGVPLQALEHMGDLLKEQAQLEGGAKSRLGSSAEMIDRLKNETKIPVPPNMSLNVTLGNEFAGLADKMLQAAVLTTRQDVGRIEAKVDSFIEALMAPAGGMA